MEIQKAINQYYTEVALNQYNTEVALYEQYGTCSIITFEEWLDIKGIHLDD